MNDKFVWAKGDVEILSAQEYARTIPFWDWAKFNKLRPEIRVCIREKKKQREYTAAATTVYTVVTDGTQYWVEIEFVFGGESYKLKISQYEISACLNAPTRYEPTLNRWVAEKFYSVTLKLA